ncbi:MAG: FecR family protein [Arcicella sp.]|jgi:ferric-dicitrate binding protein FerR (iron transport regulator)|nr:FecR family protein [Arcicella sp.]
MRLNQEIIVKYLNNECSEGEQMLVEAWYKSFENNPDGISDLPEHEYSELYHRVRKNIDQQIRPLNIYTPPRWIWYAASIAAVLLVVLGLSFYWNPDSVENMAKIKSEIPLSDWAKYENSSAKILKVSLPDGSSVWLHPKTQLSYNQSDRIYRQVNLKGEAFFDVKRDENRPFLIYSGKMTTKVLGTSFNVKAYPETERFEVSVVTGKVSVMNESEKEVLVTPKQQVVLENKSDVMIVNELPKDKTFYWELASLNFDNTSMQRVVDNIEQHFNVKIHLSPTLQQCRLSGNFNQERLATILEIVCRSIDAEYEFNENEIYLKGNGCE